MLAANLFAATYTVTKVKGSVEVLTADGDRFVAEEGMEIDSEDTLCLGDDSIVQFVDEDGNTYTIRKNVNIKVKKFVGK